MFNPFDLVFQIFETLQSFTYSVWSLLSWKFEVDPPFLPAIELSMWGIIGGVGLFVVIWSATLKLLPFV